MVSLLDDEKDEKVYSLHSHVIISINADKDFNKIQLIFMIKPIKKKKERGTSST